MPSFKPKVIKRNTSGKKNSLTLDNTHKHFLHEFSKDLNDTIPSLQAMKKKLQHDLINEDRVEEQLELTDSITKITSEIRHLQSKKKEYFLDNSKYIFDYFENKKIYR